MRLFAMTCGWLTGPRGGFLQGETGRLRVPVPCYLVDHPDGKLVFDTGLHPDAMRDPSARLGSMADIFEVHARPGEDVAARLGELGVDPGEVRWLVNSHLHFDHAGGNGLLPEATWLVQDREWEAGRRDEEIASNFFDRRDYDLGHAVRRVRGEHDVFGDGSVVCIPTFGHTPGHQSLRVRLAGGDVVLAADACYLRQTLEDLHLPAVAHDPEAMLASLRRLRALRDAGARIFYGHDPEFWQRVPQAPAEVG